MLRIIIKLYNSPNSKLNINNSRDINVLHKKEYCIFLKINIFCRKLVKISIENLKKKYIYIENVIMM